MVSVIRRVAVLGGGPSGAVAAKCLLAEGIRPVIFEQRSGFGGAWNYTAETKLRLRHVPQENPNLEDEAIARTPRDQPVFMTPMYDALETNIPKDLMIFKNTPFNNALQLFPKHEDVKQYVQDFSKDLESYTRFNKRVIRVAREADQKWLVEVQDVLFKQVEMEIFDAIIVATGHYNVPYIPPINGISEFEKKYPGAIKHSKYFRTAAGFEGKKLVVVGNSASGIDIAMQIAEVSQTPLYQSCKSTTSFKEFPSLAGTKIKIVPTISEFVPESKTVVFSDGTSESDIDMVLFCTGYLHSLPFLVESSEQSERMVTDGFYIHNLYQHMFYIPCPTFSIIGLPTKIIPFPFTECQAAVIAGVYSGRLMIPSEKDMAAWEKELLQNRPGDRHLHFLNFPQDADYMDMLNRWSEEGGDDGKPRYEATQWADKQRWIRKNIPKIKAAFIKAKADGRIAKTMEELGFSYEEGDA
ncbi:hypothetical protein H072_8608 [Dactylellina haptotyla CBS 200.50]|uniref:FAD/NAD(P)-binding domain-containing protein n=1 Tax=Dactylellina haptotyla (strain CBS 200.50) TaxID=1284197 RepID=S8A9H5_DACHA|nr:hypothetical protein H072_8608 [Dactylellina haptotyla CBS 200.50]